jgi:serine/threonine protein kinase
VVKLIDVISLKGAVDDIIVMPWLSPLETCFTADPSVKSSLMTQFLEGVSFLHKHGIAHLDLKPGNILVNHTDGLPVPHLSIIDFGVSIRVKDDEAPVTGFRGTPFWTAPEVGTKDGPNMTYSAIRADRWSCGRLLQYFCPSDASFGDVLTKLLDPDPSRRPALKNALEMLGSRSKAKQNVVMDVVTDMEPTKQKRPRIKLNKKSL